MLWLNFFWIEVIMPNNVGPMPRLVRSMRRMFVDYLQTVEYEAENGFLMWWDIVGAALVDGIGDAASAGGAVVVGSLAALSASGPAVVSTSGSAAATASMALPMIGGPYASPSSTGTTGRLR